MTAPAVLVTAVRATSFAYLDCLLELSGAPTVVDDHYEYFQPTEMRVTIGRPGPPDSGAHGTEVEVMGRPKAAERFLLTRQQWETGGHGRFDLAAADQWVQEMAAQVDAEMTVPSVLAAESAPKRFSAVLTHAARVRGTEWRIELGDAPAMQGDGFDQFSPTALLVLRSNISTHGGDFRTTVYLVGKRLGGPLGGGNSGGKRWDSDARVPRYTLASAPQWVLDLVEQHTGLGLTALVS